MLQKKSDKNINLPHGGKLTNLIRSVDLSRELIEEAMTLKTWVLTPRQVWDIELILNGGFSPLDGFLNRSDYENVLANMRLSNGIIWPIPIMLDVSDDFASDLSANERIGLKDYDGETLAILTVTDVWRPDKQEEADRVFGTVNEEHPGVSSLYRQTLDVYIGGTIEGVNLPTHHSFNNMRMPPKALRNHFAGLGVSKIIAFQTRNPMHRAHVELTKRGAIMMNSHLLIHPVVGITKPGDVDHYLRVRCYIAALKQYEAGSATLSLLPLAMRMGGPREAVWHAIIRKNYGATSFIVGRDHAGPGTDSSGKPFYGPYDAQELLSEHENELGVKMAAFEELVYDSDEKKYTVVSEVPSGHKTMSLSGTDLRLKLATGEEIPDWFSYKEVIKELRKTHPPRGLQGVAVIMFATDDSMKTSVSGALVSKVLEIGTRQVTVIDDATIHEHFLTDVVKAYDSISRPIGYIISEIIKNKGFVVCTVNFKDKVATDNLKESVGNIGAFIEIHLNSSVETSDGRSTDEEEFGGRVVINTETNNIGQCADMIVSLLKKQGYL